MDYLNLSLGIILLVVFAVILQKNSKRHGFFDAFFPDTFIGIVAGLYLVITSVSALLI